MTPPLSVPVETLLAQRAWMRSLARALVRDEAAADDLVQEAWVDALRSPPVHEGGIRGFLATILRRRARDAWRSGSRRAARERAAARPEALRPTADLVAEADLHRRVVEAVTALDEPYRGTLLQRFWEGRSVAEIAAAQGAPPATVHTRIRRGLERLRARLDAGERGGRSAWMAALLPLAGVREAGGIAGATGMGGAAAAAGGGALVGTKMVVAASIIGAAAGTLATGLAAGTLGGGPAGPPPEGGTRAEVADLRARLDSLEREVAAAGAGSTGGASAGDGAPSRVEALERRLAAVEAASAERRPESVVDRPATPEEEAAAARGRAALEEAKRALEARRLLDEQAKESVEDLRRKFCDPTLPVVERTKALTSLRMMDGIDATVVAAAVDLFRSGIEPGFREVLLRDLHRKEGEGLKRLFLDALQNDPEPRVRKRAAEDIDTWKGDAEVRIALERTRDGDADEGVRKAAGETLGGGG